MIINQNNEVLSYQTPEGYVSVTNNSGIIADYFYNVTDWLGTNRAVIDADGNVVNAHDHYPFGKRMPARHMVTDAEGNRYQFTGHEFDEETGFDYHGARYYNRELGRYMNVDRFAEKFYRQSSYVYAGNQVVNSVDVNGDSTVVVVSGYGVKEKAPNGKENIMYQVSVYQNMSINQYNAMKILGELPEADYTMKLARDAHDLSDKNGTVVHSEKRYGTNNETPPGTYYLFKPGTNGDGGGGAYSLYIGDENGKRSINGPHGERTGVAIHQYDPNDSQGCLTTCTGRNTQPITDLIKAIPDLNDDSQPVQLIIEERGVKKRTFSNSANGSIKYVGIEGNVSGYPSEEGATSAPKNPFLNPRINPFQFQLNNIKN